MARDSYKTKAEADRDTREAIDREQAYGRRLREARKGASWSDRRKIDKDIRDSDKSLRKMRHVLRHGD